MKNYCVLTFSGGCLPKVSKQYSPLVPTLIKSPQNWFGGSGGYYGNNLGWGGSGGGSIVISSSTNITLNGQISARSSDRLDSNSRCASRNGSNGVARLVAPRVFGAGRAAVVSGRPRPSPLSRPVMVGQDHVQTFCQDRGHDYVHKCQDSFSNTR